MSSVRGKYTSIPTFGLNKRSFGGKGSFFGNRTDTSPDFTETAAQAQNAQPQSNFSIPTAAVTPAPAYLQNPAPQLNGMTGASMNPTGVGYPGQGYAPPTATGAYQVGPRQAFSYSPYPNPYQAYPGNQAMGWNQMPPQPVQQTPVQQPPVQQPQPPVQTRASVQQPMPEQQEPVTARPSRTDGEERHLLALLMLTLLPVTFAIACFFHPFFYVFITLALISAAVLWYKEMGSSGLRTALTVLLSGLVIFGITWMIISDENASYAQNPVQASVPVAAVETSYENDTVDFLTPEPVVTPEPVAEASQAQIQLENFMNLWAQNNPEAMVAYVQPSWVAKQSEPAQALFKLLSNRTATAYEIEEVGGSEADTSRTIVMTATIDKNTGKAASIYRFTVMMVKEGDDWYVNPSSLQSNDEVSTVEEENVVNDSNASGLATMPPRTTVSPAPSADALLYYNPDGGNYYHMDANCSSVKEEYRPLQGSFTYRELKTYMNTLNLQPCLKCGAPTSVLSETSE